VPWSGALGHATVETDGGTGLPSDGGTMLITLIAVGLVIVAIAVGMAVGDRRRARLLRDLPDAGVQHGTGASDHDLRVAEAQAARTAGGTGYTGGPGV